MHYLDCLMLKIRLVSCIAFADLPKDFNQEAEGQLNQENHSPTPNDQLTTLKLRHVAPPSQNFLFVLS